MRDAACALALLVHFVSLMTVLLGQPWGFLGFGAGFLITGAVQLTDHLDHRYPDTEEL